MLGLTMALFSSFLIIIFVQSERSFDRFHEKGEKIYRVYMRQPGNLVEGSSSDWWVCSPAILKPTWEEELPEVDAITRTLKRKWVLQNGKTFVNEEVLLVDPEFFEVFSFPLQRGNTTNALSEPFSMVISKDMAHKYFGDGNPLGHIIMTNDSTGFTITGVLEEIPANSHLQFDFLVPLQCLELKEGRSLIHPNWTYNNSFATYLTLHDNTNVAALDDILRRYDVDGFNGTRWSFHLQPLYDIHFNRATGGTGNRVALNVLITIGFFILFIACFNYMNLSIVRHRARIRSVSLRRVNGANTGSFMQQFFIESLLLLALAAMAALFAVGLVLPWINAVLDRELQISVIRSLPVIMVIVGLIAGMAAISGFYPALYLSRLPLLSTLKGGISKLSLGGRYFRKVVVVIQFSLSLALILASLTIFRQVKYIDQKDPGFSTGNIMYMRLNIFAGIDWQGLIGPFKEELLGFPEIESVAASTGVPTQIGWSNVPEWEGRAAHDKPYFYRIAVDFDFLELYGLQVIEGRAFSRAMGGDGGQAYILNREAADRMEMDSPVGSIFGFGEQMGTVVGVLGDFHFESLHKPITPLAIGVDENHYFTYISVRFGEGSMNRQTLEKVKESWERFAPGQPFEYTFMDERMGELYKKDRQLSSSMIVLSLMALFISCLGIFGLISFSLRERTKEVGIRKVLGATPVQMGGLLIREIMIIILLATVLGGTVGWYSARAWLSNFPNRFEMGIELVLVSLMITMVMALLPLAYRLIKSANANPVDTLHTE
jgi:putative ABC transport system permease protein